MSTAAPQIVRFIASNADGLAFLTGHPLVDRFEQRPSGDDDTEFAALLKPISEEWPWPNDPMAPWPAREVDINYMVSSLRLRTSWRPARMSSRSGTSKST